MTAAPVEQFMALAREEAATAERVAGMTDVPRAVAGYLRERDLPCRCKIFGRAGDIDWASAPELETATAPLERDGDVAVTGCYAGVAEAGALVVLSAPDHPTEANVLAETHIVVMDYSSVVETFESLWSRLAADFPDSLPRTMSFIVGPSRTADLGVPSRLGAHGPARVHIIIVGP
jgi:L-lactate dehydrogenase complex protein LldG